MYFMKEPWDGFRREHYRHLGETVAKHCTEKGFVGHYAEDAEKALRLALDLIPDGTTVGIPGSVTIREIGALAALEKKGCTVMQHWDPSLSTPEEKEQRLKDELLCDVLLSSTNALTHDGILVNIDGTGNRVAAMAWGTGKVIIIAGINKITRNVESALAKIRDWATPINALRLGFDTPCAKIGHCVDCNHPQRACRAILTMERAPFGREIHVIIVGEHLGF